MRISFYLDKGASLGPAAPCLTMDGASLSYADVVAHSNRVAHALAKAGARPGDKVAVLSANDPKAFASVFGIARAGAVWCPINPRNAPSENRQILADFDCTVLLFQQAFHELVETILPDLPALKMLVCLDGEAAGAPSLAEWLADMPDTPFPTPPDNDVAMLVGTGGTTGKPKGVLLTDDNLEAMSAIMLMAYPYRDRPVYLALPPLTHAAGVLTLPVLAKGGEIVIMPKPDLGVFLSLIPRHGVSHTFLPPTLIYALLAHPDLPRTDLSSLQCFWYGAAPIAPARLEEAIQRIGPVMAQFFGQTEAPMVCTTMAPADHFKPDGSIDKARLSAAGYPPPLLQLAILDGKDRPLPPGERGEIAIRGSLVMRGYYKDEAATAQTLRSGWLHTGDIGYLDADNMLYIVDRLKDMIISGGFNVYSVEVEQALLEHADVQDCAVFGLPDEKWGEMVCAVVQLRAGRNADTEALRTFVKARIGSVKTPKHVEIWPDLPRSKVGKVLKRDIRAELLAARSSSA
ncbi:AMP-dependent acyl-CoA synthetase [Labrys okinawensis]|uniref:3-methylmercaptopropionyl-CoA ligase n=1 Tax=Labrys okinawensis TaxID=346911 RepID=A0A2S9QGB6_9HYPH|nr:long-chain fatty acid--CoA ligase [Labrys okinawensis]PRH88379.1 AMP-dependent acyl-CoA synthetase [Labrys okinawensis]